MRPFISGLLISSVVMAPMTHTAALENNALYQWETKNGTPTYSPDPPPKGVKYVVVGPDLKPLARQPSPPVATANEADDAIITTSSNVAAASTAEPAKKWKPVRYANAPDGKSQTVFKAKATAEPEVAASVTAAPFVESVECQLIKRQKLILESQFSRAKTDAEMDDTILKLHEKSREYGNKCG